VSTRGLSSPASWHMGVSSRRHRLSNKIGVPLYSKMAFLHKTVSAALAIAVFFFQLQTSAACSSFTETSVSSSFGGQFGPFKVLCDQQTETCSASLENFSFAGIQLAEWPDGQGDPHGILHNGSSFFALPTPSNPQEFFCDLGHVSNLSYGIFQPRSSKIVRNVVNIGFGSARMEGDTVALLPQVVGSHFMAHGLDIVGMDCCDISCLLVAFPDYRTRESSLRDFVMYTGIDCAIRDGSILSCAFRMVVDAPMNFRRDLAPLFAYRLHAHSSRINRFPLMMHVGIPMDVVLDNFGAFVILTMPNFGNLLNSFCFSSLEHTPEANLSRNFPPFPLTLCRFYDGCMHATHGCIFGLARFHITHSDCVGSIVDLTSRANLCRNFVRNGDVSHGSHTPRSSRASPVTNSTVRMVIPVSITVERAFGKFQQTYGIYECAPHAAETLAELLAVLPGTGGNHSRVVGAIFRVNHGSNARHYDCVIESIRALGLQQAMTIHSLWCMNCTSRFFHDGETLLEGRCGDEGRCWLGVDTVDDGLASLGVCTPHVCERHGGFTVPLACRGIVGMHGMKCHYFCNVLMSKTGCSGVLFHRFGPVPAHSTWLLSPPCHGNLPLNLFCQSQANFSRNDSLYDSLGAPRDLPGTVSGMFCCIFSHFGARFMQNFMGSPSQSHFKAGCIFSDHHVENQADPCITNKPKWPKTAFSGAAYCAEFTFLRVFLQPKPCQTWHMTLHQHLIPLNPSF
jgi:hypothetical protein